MEQFNFKTNIKCGGCIATVKPHLDELPGITSWSVDTSTPEKTLTVNAGDLSVDQIIKTVEKAGYKIEQK